MTALLVAFGAYLLGSLPFSWVVARWFGVSDVRQAGSGNVGATNVLRTAGRTAGVLALLLDGAKGALAALAGAALDGPSGLAALAAVAAVVGHVFPVWLGFRGGKGVATGAGAFLVLAPLATVAALALFVGTTAFSRFVSLGSVVGAAALPVLAWMLGEPEWTVAAGLAIAVLVVGRHAENLQRLRLGRENRLGGAPR